MVNIDTVYQRVLALANKEQRGYITPQEFNLLANHAQMDIFEQYFYDLNQFRRMPGNDTVYSDMVSVLGEKISLLEVAVGSNAIESWGMDGNSIIIPDEVYRLSQVRVAGYPVEILPTKEFNMVRESPLTSPTPARPIARRDFRGLLIIESMRPTVIVTPATHPINGSYIKRPQQVNWAFTMVGDIAMYNVGLSADFELHPSEETELVTKILSLAGITIKDQGLYQIAAGEDTKNIQQEKQ